jgi:hypothetical protein
MIKSGWATIRLFLLIALIVARWGGDAHAQLSRDGLSAAILKFYTVPTGGIPTLAMTVNQDQSVSFLGNLGAGGRITATGGLTIPGGISGNYSNTGNVTFGALVALSGFPSAPMLGTDSAGNIRAITLGTGLSFGS